MRGMRLGCDQVTGIPLCDYVRALLSVLGLPFLLGAQHRLLLCFLIALP